MRLLVLTGFWPSVSNPVCGVFVAQQCAALAQAGCDVRVARVQNSFHRPIRFITQDPPSFVLDPSSVQELRTHNVPERLFRLPGALQLNSRLTGAAIADYIARLRTTWNPDGVLVHGLRYTGTSARYWRDLVSGPVVVVLHGVEPPLSLDRITRSHRIALSRAASFVDTFVAVGSPLVKWSRKIGLGTPLVIANGTNLPAGDQVSLAQRSLAETRIVLSVSNLVKLKGIDLNLRALALVSRHAPDIHWEYRVVGDGPERGNLEQLAQTLGIADRVKFLGRLTHPDTMQQMEVCDVFSLPSWGEAFGVVYLEAMARGRAVVGCLKNGAQDIIDPGLDGLLVEPGDLPSLYQALSHLLSEPSYCSQLGAAARQTAERFSWDSNVTRLLGVFGYPQDDGALAS